MRDARIVIAVVVIGSAVAVPVVFGGERPAAVSPGGFDRVAPVEGRCPSFSWELIPDATGYELVVYRFVEDPAGHLALDFDRAEEVLYTQAPGGATSWTPALDRCLEPGGSFVWFVRAVFDTDSGEASEWSEPLFFSVASAPSAAEVERALEVLHRYVESGGDTEILDRDAAPRSSRGRAASVRPHPGGIKLAPRSVVTGTAAIRGEQPDAMGETYGVVGTSASPDGAGLGAANTVGGPDLVLDGSAGGVADAVLTESGLDRPSPAAQTFAFDNSGGGGITVEVDGIEVVTTTTDSDVLAALSCAGSEVAKWDGAAWVCAPDIDTDTMAVLGPQCSSGQLATWDGSSWICDEDADTLGNLNCWFPDRIPKWDGSIWTCAKDENTTYSPGPGVLIDGSGNIFLDPVAFSPRISTLDSAGNVGSSSALVIGADGLGLISYHDFSNHDLKVAHCDDTLCTSATLATLDSGGYVGVMTSLAIGTDGLGLISYRDVTNNDLKVAHCTGVLCASAVLSTLDSSGDVGFDTSLAVGSDGLGLISYHDSSNNHLKVAHCDDVLCASATISALDSAGSVGGHTSLAIGADGLGLISYYDGTDGNLRVAHCDNVPCTSATLSTLDTAGIVGRNTSLVIGADGLGLISYLDYTNDGLKVAHCDDVACTSATRTTLDSTNTVIEAASLAIGADGLGLIAYIDGDLHLRIAHCHDMECTSATLSVFEVYGSEASLAVGRDGLGLISYFDYLSYDLRVIHLPYGL
jgi:hypothetical protein